MKWCDKRDELIHIFKNHEGVFVQGGAATPVELLNSIAEYADDIGKLEFFHLHTHGEAPHKKIPHFKITNFFVGKNLRKALDYDRIDYLPCFLSEIPQLLESGLRNYDVALIHVSPPDKHGYCSLGVSVDIVQAAIKHAKVVVAQVNEKMPRTHGDGTIHLSKIDYAFAIDTQLPIVENTMMTPEEEKIGEHVAALIDNGSTLQMGIGSIPDAVLRALHGHKDLGIHTEMFTNSLIPLIESGVVNNKRKKIHPGKTVAGFAIGDQKLYDFVDDNPSVIFLDIALLFAFVLSPNLNTC